MPIFLNASYSVYYYGIKLGKIRTFDTLKENYILADITNRFARLLAGKKKICLFNDDFKGTFKKTKFKKDSRSIIKTLNFAIDYPKHNIKSKKIVVSNSRYIVVKCDKNCKFTTYKNNKKRYNGTIIFKKNVFYSIESDDENVKIKRD